MNTVFQNQEMCTIPFYQEKYQTTELEGHPYTDPVKKDVVVTQHWPVPIGGNTKDIKISSYDPQTGTGQVNWKEALSTQVFNDTNWYEEPTVALTIQLNIVMQMSR